MSNTIRIYTFRCSDNVLYRPNAFYQHARSNNNSILFKLTNERFLLVYNLIFAFHVIYIM